MVKKMSKLRLALIFGGSSSEREVSLEGGKAALEAFDRSKYDITTYDPKYDLEAIVKDSDNIDAAFVLLHGENGEDGRIQGLLDLLNIPYQGSGVLASALAMNKEKSKEFYKANSIPVAEHIIFNKFTDKTQQEIIDKIGFPVVIKPAIGGSSIALSLVENKKDLEDACKKALDESEIAMAEEYIQGVELTCPVIGNENPEALPVIEICPKHGHKFFDYEAKYKAGETDEICPARIDEKTRIKVQELSIKAHQVLTCKGYSRTDLILKEDKLYVLETNTIPGMTKNSLLPLSARNAGMSFSDLLDRLVKLSLE
jgi:D-alanine-D-alanine ligase